MEPSVFSRDRANFCNCVIEDFIADDRGRPCVTCIALGVTCLGGSHPHQSREQIFIKMIEKSPGVYAIVSDLGNLSPDGRKSTKVDMMHAEHNTAGSNKSGSSSSSSSTSSVKANSRLLLTDDDNILLSKEEDIYPLIKISRKRARKLLIDEKNKIPKHRNSDTVKILVSDRIKEYPNETFSEENGGLYCNACCKCLSMKKSTIKNHVEGSTHLSHMAALNSGLQSEMVNDDKDF